MVWEKKVITNINWSVCYDVEDSDMSTDIVWAELGVRVCMCVCLCMCFEGFLKHHIHQICFCLIVSLKQRK